MISKLSLAAATFAAATLLAVTPGMAQPGALGALKGGTPSMVEQTHGWHRTCRAGLNGMHRHVPGVGRIQCGNRRCHVNKWGVRRCVWS